MQLLRIQVYAWIVFSAIIICGFFAIMYLLCFRPLVVGSANEWKYIEIMFGALATVFGQITNGWISWFAALARAFVVGTDDTTNPKATP